MANKKITLPHRVMDIEGKFDTDGQCWTERKFAYPNRTIRIASTLSGIGAPEMALKRLGIKTKHIFACDIGERYLRYNYKQLISFTSDLGEEDKKLFAHQLYIGNKSQQGETFTEDSVYHNLYEAENPADIELELVKDCIDLLTKDMDEEQKRSYIADLYNEKGINYVKENFCANYDIAEQDYYTDIRFLDATKYKGQVDLYVGGSPCTSYSISGKRLGLEDTRGTLFYDFTRTIAECQPKVFIYENVVGMMNCGKETETRGDEFEDLNDTEIETLEETETAKEGKTIITGLEAALDVFQSLGYQIYWQVLDGRNYGIPQHRERIWLIGFKEPREFIYPKPIPLTTRIHDYLDTDIPPKSDRVEFPYVRFLTGTECLRLQGFVDFKVSPKVEALGKSKRNTILCQQAGNSMVVDCIMALLKQMDISQYGVEADPIMSVEKGNYIDNSILEQMNEDALSDLIARASTILKQKQLTTKELEITDSIEVKETCEKVSQSEENDIVEECEDTNVDDIPQLDSLLKLFKLF